MRIRASVARQAPTTTAGSTPGVRTERVTHRRLRTSAVSGAKARTLLALGLLVPMALQEPSYASSHVISAVAGNGTAGFSGDGGLATSAQLDYPTGLDVDSSGNVYFADTANNRIRRVDATTGIITSLTVSWLLSSPGFWSPEDVAFDAFNNMYIADTGNSRVLKIDSAGVAITVAQRQEPTHWGFAPIRLAFDSLGNLFISSINPGRVYKLVGATGPLVRVAGGGTGGDGSLAIDAGLSPSVRGIAVDGSGNLFIADLGQHRIRRVDAVTQIISTVAGTGTAGFSGDGGSATSAQLNEPSGLALAASGDLFIADSANHRIRLVKTALATPSIDSYAGTGTAGWSGDGGLATSAQLRGPTGVALDTSSGNLFIGDSDNHRVRKVVP